MIISVQSFTMNQSNVYYILLHMPHADIILCHNHALHTMTDSVTLEFKYMAHQRQMKHEMYQTIKKLDI